MGQSMVVYVYIYIYIYLYADKRASAAQIIEYSKSQYVIQSDRLLDDHCVEEIVLLFVQIFVYVFSYCRI
jgi:hypothetical protein